MSLVVYPALAAVPAAGWADAHAAHSRRIVPLVAVVYGSALVAGAGALLIGPSPARLVCVAATVAAVGLTAALAAPWHGRLGAGRDPALIRRLLVVDRLRTALAVLALAAAVVATGTRAG